MVFTSQEGSTPFIQTWPIWLMVSSACLAPWIFNPRSFQGQELILNLYEFEEWLDPYATDGWEQWHANALRPQRTCSGRRKVAIYLGSKLVPKLLLFTAATAALRIDPTTDGTRFNYAIFRTIITSVSGVAFIVIGLIYQQLTHPRLLTEIFGPLRFGGYTYLFLISQTCFLWGLRVATIYGHIATMWALFGDHMNGSRQPDLTDGRQPYNVNSGALVVAAISIHVLVVQLLSFIPDQPRGFFFCSRPVLCASHRPRRPLLSRTPWSACVSHAVEREPPPKVRAS